MQENPVQIREFCKFIFILIMILAYFIVLMCWEYTKENKGDEVYFSIFLQFLCLY